DDSADHGADVLGELTATSGTAASATLNAQGLAVVQAWVSGARPNRGFALLFYGTDSPVFLDDREVGGAESRPRLNISYGGPGALRSLHPVDVPGWGCSLGSGAPTSALLLFLLLNLTQHLRR